MKIKIIFLCLTFLITSCSTLKSSLTTGIVSGTAIGAGAGAIGSPKGRGKGALVGALLGGIIGGIGSYVLHKQSEKRDEKVRRETLFNLGKNNVAIPTHGSLGENSYGYGLTTPLAECELIDTEIKGKKLIGKHQVCTITEEPQWVPSKGGSDDGK